MSDSESLEILNALSKKHQQHLFSLYVEALARKPKPKTIQQKLQRLATVLKAKGVQPYRNLYLERKARFVNLFTPADEKLTTDAIVRRIQKHWPNWTKSAKPVLTQYPQFNRMIRNPDGSLELDFVSLGAERLVPDGDGYDFTLARPPHHDMILVGAEPAIIEIYSRTAEQSGDLRRAFAQALGMSPDDFVERAFDRPQNWKALKEALKAEIFSHNGNRVGQHQPAHYAMAAKNERLEDLPMWQALDVNHDLARELGFFFDFEHEVDGMIERAYYYVQTTSGQIKFLDNISEAARRKVVSEYLKIV